MIEGIRRAALRWLARRDYAYAELQQRLQARGFPLADIHTVLDTFRAENLLNDTRFAHNYCRWRQGKGFGPLRIQMELKAKGLGAQTIAELSDIPDNAWLIVAQRVWRKHFKGQKALDFKQRAKQMRFLQQRGFTMTQIKEVLGGDELEYRHCEEIA